MYNITAAKYRYQMTVIFGNGLELTTLYKFNIINIYPYINLNNYIYIYLILSQIYVVCEGTNKLNVEFLKELKICGKIL